MDEAFDPYYQWLGIPVNQQPPSYYRLLALQPGEADRSLIAAATDQRLALVEAQRGGVHEEHCDRLLAELRHARATLLDPHTKAVYDTALHSTPPPPVAAHTTAPPPPPPPPPLDHANSEAAPSASLDKQSEQFESLESRTPSRSPLLAWLTSLVSLTLIAVASWLLTTYLLGNHEASELPSPAESKPAIPEPPDIDPDTDDLVVVLQEGDGSVLLKPIFCRLDGAVQIAEHTDSDVLKDWAVGDAATWRFRLVKPGAIKVLIEYAADDAWADSEYEISIDSDSKRTCTVRGSGGADQFLQDEYFLAAEQNGEHTFTLRAIGLANEGLMVLKSVRLVPR